MVQVISTAERAREVQKTLRPLLDALGVKEVLKAEASAFHNYPPVGWSIIADNVKIQGYFAIRRERGERVQRFVIEIEERKSGATKGEFAFCLPKDFINDTWRGALDLTMRNINIILADLGS